MSNQCQIKNLKTEQCLIFFLSLNMALKTKSWFLLHSSREPFTNCPNTSTTHQYESYEIKALGLSCSLFKSRERLKKLLWLPPESETHDLTFYPNKSDYSELSRHSKSNLFQFSATRKSCCHLFCFLLPDDKDIVINCHN